MKVLEEIRRLLGERWPWAIVDDLDVLGDAGYFRELATSLPLFRGATARAQEVLYLRDGRYLLLRELDTTRAPDLDELAGLVEGERREEDEGALRWVVASGLSAVGDGPRREFHAFVAGTPVIELYAPSGDETQWDRADAAIGELGDPGFELPEAFQDEMEALLLELLRSIAGQGGE